MYDRSKRNVVLVVDDDPGDQELTRRALEDSADRIELHFANDGEQAQDYLMRCGDHADPQQAPRPHLILLDLNMPRMGGREVLEWLRHDEELRRIPVVVLTTSKQEEDILRSYDLGCNSFITKPVNVDDFNKAIKQLGDYWFDITSLPAAR